MRYSLSAGMHLSTSSDSPPGRISSCCCRCCGCCSIRFQTFSFAAEKKLLQIYCLCFCFGPSRSWSCPVPVPSSGPGPRPGLVVLAVIIIIISVVSAFVAAAALNTKEFPICWESAQHRIHRPEARRRTDFPLPRILLLAGFDFFT